MIYDHVDNLDTYRGLYENLDKAIDFLQKNDLSALPNGKNIVDGDELFINVTDGKLSGEDEGIYELHRHYLDLHIDITGSEKILFCDYADANVTHPYEENGDYALLTGEKTAECLLDKSHFAVCMLGEPHKPCVKTGESSSNHKAIFKIRVN